MAYSNLAQQIATELAVKPQQVAATVRLLDDGATVPFIARYRKEATDGLDDTQLRRLEERLGYLREFEQRRSSILKTIEAQQKLTPALQKTILATTTKTALEDLYRPYKPKRRTKGQIAIAAGLAPLAQKLFENPLLEPEDEARAFICSQVDSTRAALDGARYILMERFSEDAALLAKLRQYLRQHGLIRAQVVAGQQHKGAKFSDYFDFHEAIARIPSHRSLALFRGRNEGILQLSLVSHRAELEPSRTTSPCVGIIANHLAHQASGRPADAWLTQVIDWTWRIKLQLHMESEFFSALRDTAEGDAIRVFAANLHDLLMAAPAGPKITMGLDPGLRTGVKVVVVDDTGKLLSHCAIFPHPPQKQWQASITKLKHLIETHAVNLISIGNGTASRETDALARQLLTELPQRQIDKLVVSEAGASVYSASELAAEEFPTLDVSYRGAVSIARRLQDPLAELVKIDPKAIGVGQYQHDVSQLRLARALNTVVEDCVNGVGVDLNTASAPLLTRVSGLNRTLAKNIIDFRDQHGRFTSRAQLLDVARLGPKAFEQAAGFLRVPGGKNPLDASSVHPEAYPLVKRIIAQCGVSETALLRDPHPLRSLQAERFVDERFGLPTVRDVLAELEKPGHDPRPAFTTASFQEGVESLADLKTGMRLEGVVTNVTNFGAFVDIGVHQDGLVHISMLADRFIKDPHDEVKTGAVVKVWVIGIDQARRRIGLSMKSKMPIGAPETTANQVEMAKKRSGPTSPPARQSAFGDLLNAALLRKQ